MQATIDLENVDLHSLTSDLHKVEDAHRVREKSGRIMPNPRFLLAVAEKLSENGITVETPSEAWQAWKILFNRMDAVRKQLAQDAALAFWYGINPFELSKEQRTGLLANLDTMKAQDTLHGGNFNPADPERVYNLVLVATGDERLAVRARGDAMENLIAQRSGE